MELFNALFILAVFSFTAFTPYWSKRDILFGYRISSDLGEHPEVRKFKRNYTLSLLAVMAGLFVVVLVNAKLFWITVPIYLVANLVIFLVGRAQAKVFVNAHREMINIEKKVVVSTVRREIGVSPWWFLINVAIIVFGIVVIAMQYRHLPEQLPTRYDFSGHVTGYELKSWRSLMTMPLIQVIVTVMLFYVYKTIGMARVELSGKDLQAAEERLRIFKKRTAATMIYMSVMMNLLFGFISLTIVQVVPFSGMLTLGVVLSFTVLLIAPPLVVFAVTGQGGSRVKLPKEEAGKKEIVRADDDNWKWGMFYYNPDDPSLWVEKRFGIGYSVNFARPGAWVIIAILAIVILGSSLLGIGVH